MHSAIFSVTAAILIIRVLMRSHNLYSNTNVSSAMMLSRPSAPLMSKKHNDYLDLMNLSQLTIF